MKIAKNISFVIFIGHFIIIHSENLILNLFNEIKIKIFLINIYIYIIKTFFYLKTI